MTGHTLGQVLYEPLEVAPSTWLLSADDHPMRENAEFLIWRTTGQPVKLGEPGTLTLHVRKDGAPGPYGVMLGGVSLEVKVRVWIGEVVTE